MIRPAANYDAEWPNDHEFYPELSILKQNLGTVLAVAAICFGEIDGEAGVLSIDYLVCSEIRGEASSIKCEQPQ